MVGLTALSVPIIALITVATAFGGDLELGRQFRVDGLTFAGFAQGVAIGSAFFIGFESCAAFAAETRDPGRAIPRAIGIIPVGLGALYLLAVVIQVPALIAGSADLAAGASPAAVLAETSGLGFIAEVIDAVLAVSLFAGLIGFMNYGP